MRIIIRSGFVLLFIFLFSCQITMGRFSDSKKEKIKKEVESEFYQLLASINNKNAVVWSQRYSDDSFISTICGTDFYDKKNIWVDTITNYFSIREKQKVDLIEVRITPLTPNLALMTSEEKSEMIFKDGKNSKVTHVFTMIWKKENGLWNIIHSHESWIEK